jgi:hypothetical protein
VRTARRGDEMPDWVASKERRLATIREAKAALEAEAQAAAAKKPEGGEGPPAAPPAKAPRNFTDPQSRIIKTKDGFVQCFNAQAAVDATGQVIVAEMVSDQSSDCPHLVGLVEPIASNLQAQPDKSRPMPDIARRIIWRRSRPVRSTPTSPPAGTNTACRRRRRAPPNRQAGWRRWPRSCAPRVIKVPTGCASRWSNRGLARSSRRAASANSCGAVWRRGLAAVRREWSLICTVHNLLKLASARRKLHPTMATMA